MEIEPGSLTAGILAGGAGRRLGGVDKGWYEIGGQPLIERTLARVTPQCSRVVISANRSLARYRALGYTVHVDDSDHAAGPLTGIATVLRAAVTPYVLTVPVDTPLLPADLVAWLSAAIRADTQLAVACGGDRIHALHALMRRDVLDDLEAALFAGTRAVRDWQAGLKQVRVDWPDSECFANINSVEDAEALASRL